MTVRRGVCGMEKFALAGVCGGKTGVLFDLKIKEENEIRIRWNE